MTDTLARLSFIPEGTNATIHTWSVQRDSRNFLYPNTFWPERWLIAEGLEKYQGGSEQFVHNETAFIPFSFGPNNCVGKNLALLEMKMIICLMMQKLEMRFVEGYDAEGFERTVEDWYLMRKGPVSVVVEYRG